MPVKKVKNKRNKLRIKNNVNSNDFLQSGSAVAETLQISCTFDDLPDVIFENIDQIINSDSLIITIINTSEDSRVSIINSLKFAFNSIF
jgi:hypothetical protein